MTTNFAAAATRIVVFFAGLHHVWPRQANLFLWTALLFSSNFLCFLSLGPMSRVLRNPEPVFVNLIRSPGIDSQPGGIDSSESIPGLHKRLQIRTPVLRTAINLLPQRDYSTRVSVPRRNWVPPPPPPQAGVSPLLDPGGGATLACGWGGPNSDDWKERLALCILLLLTSISGLLVLLFSWPINLWPFCPPVLRI
jgi:hypothetical protein